MIAAHPGGNFRGTHQESGSMPIRWSVEAGGKLTIFTGTGEITYTEVREAIEAFYAGTQTTAVLWDLREANARKISSGEVDQLALLLNQFGSVAMTIRTALVTPLDNTYGLSRMLISLLEGRTQDLPVNMRAFRSMDEARAWLSEDS
jgi:hypothetical protein